MAEKGEFATQQELANLAKPAAFNGTQELSLQKQTQTGSWPRGHRPSQQQLQQLQFGRV
jgi:hypothetical protein